MARNGIAVHVGKWTGETCSQNTLNSPTEPPPAEAERQLLDSRADHKPDSIVASRTVLASMSAAASQNADDVGYTFSHGSRITHGSGANIKKPFDDIDLTMHELSPSNERGFRGQLGFIEFTTDYRLPRHIHMSSDQTRLVDERIVILNGVALLEIAGEYYAVAPGSLVDTVGGVPHSFTACPAGVKLPDGSVSNGKFTMVYEYEEPTRFFPTVSTKVVKDVSEYKAWEGDLDVIKLPKMNADQVVAKAQVIFDRQKCKLSLA